MISKTSGSTLTLPCPDALLIRDVCDVSENSVSRYSILFTSSIPSSTRASADSAITMNSKMEPMSFTCRRYSLGFGIFYFEENRTYLSQKFIRRSAQAREYLLHNTFVIEQ